ncbi:hypothetical protein BKA64DRAFT_722401 [Cadophora sp. MPI-SDFR-AT-0126]|nr:hypothetical protein BKA64DRAFT_722401 [Leotiomycetes sp. MPI-SDFR-AT-0126]
MGGFCIPSKLIDRSLKPLPSIFRGDGGEGPAETKTIVAETYLDYMHPPRLCEAGLLLSSDGNRNGGANMVLSHRYLLLWQVLLYTIPVSAVVLSTPLSAFSNVQSGDSLTLTWTDAEGGVTLTLKAGTSTNLRDVEVIGCELTYFSIILVAIISNLPGTSYIWTVPTTLATDTYAIQIEDSTNIPNYSVQFQIQGSDSGSGGGVIDTITSDVGGAVSTATSVPSTATSTGGVIDTITSIVDDAASSATIRTTTGASSSTSISSRVSSTSTSTLSSSAESEFSTFSTSASTSTSNTSSPSPTSTSPSNTNTTTPPDSSSGRSGLSTGAKAGIGVGAALGFLVFVALAFWWGRRSAAAARHRSGQGNDNALGKAVLGAEEKRKAELEGGDVVVLSEEEKGELERRRRAAELEGREVVGPVEGGGGVRERSWRGGGRWGWGGMRLDRLG